MSRRGWIIISIFALAGLMAAGVGGVLILMGQTHTLSEGASPDGTWSVAVVGKRRFNGAYEIVVEIRDAQGQVTSAFVIGLTRDLAQARRQHAVTFLDNTKAKVGGRTVDKPGQPRH